jgi:hypothetical protein
MQRGRRSPVDGVGGRRCCDNALCERLFATLGCGRSIASRGEARVTVFEFVEDGYNPHRRRSSIGYGSSVDYDKEVLHHITPRHSDVRADRRYTVHRNGTIPCALAGSLVGTGGRCGQTARAPSALGLTNPTLVGGVLCSV